MQTDRWLYVVTAILIALFIYTAVSKIIDFNTYAEQMRNQPLPRWFNSLLIWAVPITELVASFLLLVEGLRYFGFVLSFSLLLTFTLYVALILSGTFHYVPCSCAGIFSSMGWMPHLFVNLFLTALAGIGLVGITRQRQIHRS